MTGLACCLLIALYVFDELSYERWNPDSDRIYRINSDIRYGASDFNMAVTSDPMGPALAKDYPQVESYVRLRSVGNWILTKGTESYVEEKVLFADSSLFDVFPFKILAGSAKQALAVNCMVMDETMARKYFGSVDAAVGQTLLVDKSASYRITAVIADIPSNTHFRPQIFLSMANQNGSREGSWVSHNYTTYLKLRKGTDMGQFNRNFRDINSRYVGPYLQKILGMDIAGFEKQGNFLRYSLMPIRDIHLRSNRGGELDANSNIQYAYIFSAIAFFILLIACINFMNLATAQSTGRAREVGIRKVLGGERSSLIARFLSESTVTVVLALILAVLAVILVLPAFNSLSGKSLSLSNLLTWRFLVVMAAIPLMVGLLAGSYPAFFLSAFQPIAVLKGTLRRQMGGARLRSILVVAQFTVTIILLTGTVVIYRQLYFIQHKQLGFNKEQVLIIQNTYLLTTRQAETFRKELEHLPGAESATVAAYLPTNTDRSDNPFFPDAAQQGKGVSMQNWQVDEAYLKTMRMEMVSGRFFSPEFPTDSNAVVLNEAAVKAFGFKEPVVGRDVYYFTGDAGKTTRRMPVIGVVKDFHFSSMHSPIGPLCFLLQKTRNNAGANIAVRTTATVDKQAFVKAVEKQWKAFSPGQQFSYSFMDKDFEGMYQAEQKVGKIALLFAALAIIIAYLGLFGLVAYVVEQRTKEIGIRKVLGASVANVVSLLSKDFLRLVLIAILLATPLAWYLMQQWLKDYAYRINLEWWMFVLAGAVATGVAVLTISFQSVKAALLNPVKSLKTE